VSLVNTEGAMTSLHFMIDQQVNSNPIYPRPSRPLHDIKWTDLIYFGANSLIVLQA
jgi:hypothetical protein